jgi:hypothetical protein
MALSSVSTYLCPSRRGGRAFSDAYFPDGGATTAPTTTPADPAWNQCSAGPRTDYAPIIVKAREGWWNLHVRWHTERQLNGNDGHADEFVGPFRLPVWTFSRQPDANGRSGHNDDYRDAITSWSPRFDISYLKDGASNQILFGEKYIPLHMVNSDAMFSHATWDCSYIGTFRHTFARLIHDDGGRLPIIARSPGDVATDINATTARGFGSNHPGICNFLLGDGSVHPVAIATDYKILFYLGHTDSGQTTRLP